MPFEDAHEIRRIEKRVLKKGTQKEEERDGSQVKREDRKDRERDTARNRSSVTRKKTFLTLALFALPRNKSERQAVTRDRPQT